MQALNGWKNFQRNDLLRLKTQFGASWVVLQNEANPAVDFECPYQNDSVRVCRLP